MFIAIMHAAGDQWIALGETADEARGSLSTIVQEKMIDEDWSVSFKTRADPLEGFGVWVMPINPGEVYRDTTRYDINGQLVSDTP